MAKIAQLSQNGEPIYPKTITTAIGVINKGKLLSTYLQELEDSISAETQNRIAAIQALDYTGTTAVTGQYVKTITETDGIIAATFGQVAASEVSNSSNKDAISASTTVQKALDALADKSAAQELVAKDKSVIVAPIAEGDNAGKTGINVNIKSGEKVLTLDSANGLYTDIKLSGVTVPDTNVKEAWALIASDGITQLGQTIKIYKDSAYVEIYLGTSADTINTQTGVITKEEGDKQSLNYAYIKADGTYDLVKVDVSAFIAENEFADGLVVSGGIVSVKIDNTSESFLSVSSNGVKLSGVQDAIDSAINALDVTNDTAVAGQYVAAIQETDGIVSVKTRANVSDAVLTGYEKGTKPADTSIASTDTINQAISKLENQIDDAKAAATTEVVEGTDNDHIAITSGTSASDGHTIYTITATDVASESALTAEITARKAIDGQNGQTYAANTNANYINAATSLNDADIKLDAQLKKSTISGSTDITPSESANGTTLAINFETNGVVSGATKSVKSGDVFSWGVTAAQEASDAPAFDWEHAQ